MFKTATHQHRAGDASSLSSVRIFNDWQTHRPSYIWTEAYLDSELGLLLIDRTHDTSLHFRAVSCGYTGDGPRAAALILSEAGFGTELELQQAVMTPGTKAYEFKL